MEPKINEVCLLLVSVDQAAAPVLLADSCCEVERGSISFFSFSKACWLISDPDNWFC